jgi:putative endopeptidase
MNKTKLIWAVVPIIILCSWGVTQIGQKRTQFFEISGIDAGVKPADNFFQYANGGWYKTTEIPADKTGWGSFVQLGEENKKNLHSIIADLASNDAHPKGSIEQKVGDLYASGMDTVAIEAMGISVLTADLKKIEAIKSVDELIAYCTLGYRTGNGSLFSWYIGADEKNSNMNIMNMMQTGTGLPEKDYYFKKDERTLKIKEGYANLIQKYFELIGNTTEQAKNAAQEIIALETAIAKTHRSRIEMRNPEANYNKYTLAKLNAEMPELKWNTIFANIGVKLDSVNIAQPDYYKGLYANLKNNDISIWKKKLIFSCIQQNASYLPKSFRNASFDFYGSLLNGQKAQEPRWRTMTSFVDGSLGELTGQLYVKKYFTPEAKNRMDELVSNLMTAYQKRLANLDWMSQATKAKALVKLSTIMRKIGYPSKWKTYDDITIVRNNFYANGKSVDAYEYNDQIKRLGKPVDKTEWGMTTSTVNAYYNPSYNEIVFPAGILQFPFFDPNADDAINYGGIGMVIGHEITHGFDDQGCQYDAAGNMQNWWNEVDAEKFKAKTNQVIEQYNAFTIFDTVHVKGELTLGENIADFGGLAISYDAFKMTKQGQSNEKIDGYTPDQRYFLGFAQVWRIKKRDQLMRLLIDTDPHSPAEHRVNGPLSNFEPFYKAFDVKPENKMFRPENTRAKVW